MILLLAGIVVLAASGVPAIVSRGRTGEVASTLLVLTGTTAGVVAASATLATGHADTLQLPWSLPNALLAFRLDPLAAAFLLPIFILGALAAVYGLAYWPAREQTSAGRVRAFSGLLLAGMATVVIAAHAILFLVAWETMAVAAFFLIAAEDHDADVRRAAWIYLIATHAGSLMLLALFVLMRVQRGTFLLGPIGAASVGVTSTILVLALLGFGFKAGIVPLHFWLPGAHANAPNHVSALLSGAMLKVGVYGIIRVVLYLPHPQAWWGGLLIGLGLVSAFIAINLALVQSDMKRALAYSSIENVGIIIVAIGLSVVGRAIGAPALAALGLAGAIAHVWSHSLFKGLLFLVLHATGTRRIDSLGGLLRLMPTTGNVFVIGAAAASVLPGTNAFASEALLYFGLVSAAPRGSMATLAAAIVALVGALAVACFVRLTGAIFLGSARTDAAAHAHEAPLLMRAPLVILAIACLAFGVFPAAIAGPLETITGASGVIAAFLHAMSLPLQLGAVASALGLTALLAGTRRAPRSLTWDCGYARPTARMQYTAQSISEWFTSHLTPRLFRPAIRLRVPSGLYPERAAFAVEVDEPFADRLLEPLAWRWAARLMRLRWLQQGRLHFYLIYIFVTLIACVVWMLVFPLVGGGR